MERSIVGAPSICSCQSTARYLASRAAAGFIASLFKLSKVAARLFAGEVSAGASERPSIRNRFGVRRKHAGDASRIVIEAVTSGLVSESLQPVPMSYVSQ